MTKYAYFILVCVLTVLDIVLLLVSLRYRERKAVKSLILLVLLVIAAHVFFGASLVIRLPWLKFFVHEMKFIGVVYFSVGFYIMYMQFFEKERMLSKGIVASLCVVPTLSLLLALTNNFHHLFRTEMFVVEKPYGSFIGVQSGVLFYVYMLYSYVIFTFVLVFAIRAYIKTPKLYRSHLGIMGAAAIVTLLINFISVSGFLFEDFGDATLISFTVAVSIQFYGLVLYKPARMIRIARALAVNETKDPLIAFDCDDKFLDMNIAASELFSVEEGETRGDFLARTLSLPDLTEDAREETVEYKASVYAARMRKVYDEDGAFIVSFLSLSDHTERKERERELENIVNFDTLTGIANRHAYLRELRRLRDTDLPISVIHFNIRGMKSINRSQGNEAGDAVIRQVAGVLASARPAAFCARTGGDEFTLLLRNTSHSEAQEVIRDAEKSLGDIRIASGLAVKQTNLDNINIIDRMSMDDLAMNKLLGSSGGSMRRG